MVSSRTIAAAALMAGAGAAAQAPGGAAAEFGSSSADVARIRAMDVAGVRLGMSPEQARAALRASGYSPTPDRAMYTDGRPKVERNYDYATRVDQERRLRLSDGSPMPSRNTIVAEDWNKGDERVHVAYVPTRDGVVAADVLYTIPAGRLGWQGIRSSVVSRYGRPTRVSEGLHTVRYCGDGACAAVGADFAEMSLTDGWRLELADGGAFERLSLQQASADADASIRKTAKPSF